MYMVSALEEGRVNGLLTEAIAVRVDNSKSDGLCGGVASLSGAWWAAVFDGKQGR